MCGIIHCKRLDNKPARKTVLKRYEAQSLRGKDGFGYVGIKNGYVTEYVKTETEKGIKKKVLASTDDEMLFHHRIPTSTPNFKEVNHPIYVSNKILKHDYYVIHNGIISNCDDLKKDHEKKGFSYTTRLIKKYETISSVYSEEMYNDSESMAIDLALSIEKGEKMQSFGSIAFIALQVEKETKKVVTLFYGRNEGNPLCLEQTENYFCLSSETGRIIASNILYSLDYATNVQKSIQKDIGFYPHVEKAAVGGGYPFWNLNTAAKDTCFDFYGSRQRYEQDLYGLEEEEITIEKQEELEYLQEELREYQKLNDYDSMLEVENEIQILQLEIEAENKTKRLGFFHE